MEDLEQRVAELEKQLESLKALVPSTPPDTIELRKDQGGLRVRGPASWVTLGCVLSIVAGFVVWVLYR